MGSGRSRVRRMRASISRSIQQFSVLAEITRHAVASTKTAARQGDATDGAAASPVAAVNSTNIDSRGFPSSIRSRKRATGADLKTSMWPKVSPPRVDLGSGSAPG